MIGQCGYELSPQSIRSRVHGLVHVGIITAEAQVGLKLHLYWISLALFNPVYELAVFIAESRHKLTASHPLPGLIHCLGSDY